MKTIFISMFEGVEAKNLLRTAVVPTLLARKDVRVVLLMKSTQRVARYAREFAHPNLHFEVMPYDRSLGNGLDRLFGYLKFTLLNTRTTRLRRAFAFQERKNVVQYLWQSALSMALARRSVRRLVRYLDYRLVAAPPGLEPAFEKWHPDLVVLAHLFEEPEVHVLRVARRRGIKVVGIVNSWDKVTSRAIMRLVPDQVLVFNDMVKDEMIRYNDVAPGRIRVCGIPQYDYLLSTTPTPRAEFMKACGIPAGDTLVVFAPFGRSFNATTWEAVDLLERMRSSGAWGNRVSLLVRFQPNDFIEEEEIRKRPGIHFQIPGERFSAERGVDWDMGEKGLNELRDTLAHMDALVCYASSIAIDALIFDKPVINIAFELTSGEVPSKLPTKHYEFEHYQKVLRHGAFGIAHTKEELEALVKEALERPHARTAQRRALLKEQLWLLDGRAGERMAQHILKAL